VSAEVIRLVVNLLCLALAVYALVRALRTRRQIEAALAAHRRRGEALMGEAEDLKVFVGHMAQMPPCVCGACDRTRGRIVALQAARPTQPEPARRFVQ
jgi:hypothetical protein